MPDYSKLPKSWGVQLPEDSERRQLFYDNVKPLLKDRAFDYDSYEAYYGVNSYGNVNVSSNPSYFDKVYTIEEFIELTEGSELPDKWRIKVTEENNHILSLNKDGRIDQSLGFWLRKREKNEDYTCYKYGFMCSHIPHGYTEISFETFQQKVLKQEPTKSTTMNMQEKVVIPQELLIEANKDATEVQKMLLITNIDFFTREATKKFVKNFYDKQVQKNCSWRKKIENAFPFVKDEEIDLSTGMLDGRILYEDNTERENLIAIRKNGTHHNKAFSLNVGYNWEVKDDFYGKVLIPTKK